jgi:Fe-S cluster assembly iron-binding protein IscA
MLALTRRAAEVIRRITGHRLASDQAGLRIARPAPGDGSTAGFQVAAVDEPEPGDSVVEQDGARVFLGPVATSQFDDHELDVETDAQGRAEFRTRPSTTPEN